MKAISAKSRIGKFLDPVATLPASTTRQNVLAASGRLPNIWEWLWRSFPQHQLDFIDAAVAEMLKKRGLIERIKQHDSV